MGRSLDDDASDWVCAADEYPASSCCDFTTQLEAIRAAPECAPITGVVSLALGQDSTVGLNDVRAALDDFCPSSCAASVATLIASYADRSPLGRLCPMVMDGIWRLSVMCTTDTGGPPSLSAYCLPTYLAAYQSLDRVHTPLSAPQLTAMCGRPCQTKLAAAAAAQAALLARAVLPGDTSDAAALALYASRRVSALGRIFNILCSRDPRSGAYCVLQSNIFARPDSSGQGAPLSQSVARSLALERLAGMGPTTSRFNRGEGALFAREMQAGDVPGTVAVETGDLRDSDDFQTALNPLRRFKFVCSPCGRALTYGLMHLSELFGLEEPLGPANAHLTPDAISVLLDQGCGFNAANGNRTCLQMIAQSSQDSPRYDQKLGLAASGLALCADFATQVHAGASSAQCPVACTYALQAASTAFGCCLPAILRLAEITGRAPFANGTQFAAAAQEQCNVPGVFTGRCSASARRFVATLLTNVRHSWVTSNAQRQEAIGRAWATDLANAVGADPTTMTVVDVLPLDEAKAIVVIVAIDATGDDASVDTLSSAQSITAVSAVPLTAVTTALSAGADYSAGAALWDVTTPVTTADVSSAYAPQPEPLGGATSGVEPHVVGAVGLLACALVTLSSAF